jgi:hypothetical protein
MMEEQMPSDHELVSRWFTGNPDVCPDGDSDWKIHSLQTAFRRARAFALALLAATALQAQTPPPAQLTVDQPVRISLEATQPAVRPGARSFIILHIAIPDGFWIGAAEGEVRSPGPTRPCSKDRTV